MGQRFRKQGNERYSQELSPSQLIRSHQILSGSDLEGAKERKLVVAIGASAGGLRALQELLGLLPCDTGMSFVVVQHLSRHFESLMDQLLVKHTQMPVRVISEGMPLEPNHVYLNSPNAEARVFGDAFTLNEFTDEELRLPINAMFHSVANQYGQDAVGIVMSGTGSDGAVGLQSIHQMQGLTIVQSPESAQFDGMPKSAIATEQVDYVAGTPQIAELLTKHALQPVSRTDLTEQAVIDNLTGVRLIFSLLSQSYGIDFAHYKPTTVARRIDRRLKLSRYGSLEEYAEVLRENASELDLLYHDLLIGVTKFFRDSEAFELLRSELLVLIHDLPSDEELRIWSVGCASGEEAYSLGILIFEIFDSLGRTPNFKVFATDVHERTLEIASRGIYKRSEVSGLSEERLAKHFNIGKNDEIRANSHLRNQLVFAKQNVVIDPPFTRIHLVTCRNLLIYLQEDFQAAAIYGFRFSLRDNGLMMLGPSETLGRLAPGFDVVDKSWRLFRKNAHPISKLQGSRAIAQRSIRNRKSGTLEQVEAESQSSRVSPISHLLLSDYLASALLLDQDRNILHVFGAAKLYLSGREGKFRGKVMDFFHDDAGAAIATVLIQACNFVGKEFRSSSLSVGRGDDTKIVDVIAKAFFARSTGQTVILLKFSDHVPWQPDSVEDESSSGETDSVGHEVTGPQTVNQQAVAHYHNLGIELANARESLGATIEELEASNQELQSANEEMIASNEELQATNEELQSVNEELHTVNIEHQKKVQELQEMTVDFNNLFNSTGVGSILLDEQLNIRKFTQQVTRYFNLMEHDVGRPLANFACQIDMQGFTQKVREVMKTGRQHTEYAADKKDEWLEITIIPYRSADQVRGVIINLKELSSAIDAWKERMQT